MYKNEEICRLCKRASCAYPTVCKNLNTDHGPLLRIYEEARQVPGIKHCFIGSGIRYDLCLSDTGNKEVDKTNRRYLETVIRHHVSGRFKVAPEHCSPTVLGLMRKPAFGLFQQLKSIFDEINRKHRLNEQIIPYFISSHPGCRPEDMAELAVATKALDFKLEQVQDFTPHADDCGDHHLLLRLSPLFATKNRHSKIRKRKKTTKHVFLLV